MLKGFRKTKPYSLLPFPACYCQKMRRTPVQERSLDTIQQIYAGTSALLAEIAALSDDQVRSEIARLCAFY